MANDIHFDLYFAKQRDMNDALYGNDMVSLDSVGNNALSILIKWVEII